MKNKTLLKSVLYSVLQIILMDGFRLREKDKFTLLGAFSMISETSLLTSQIVVQICLFLIAAIAIFGGALQMCLGQPNTSPRLDNVHRFMAGVYLSTGLISLWAGITIRDQGFLIYLIAFGILLSGCGRLLSISKVGLPKPVAVWLGYLVPELVIPFIMAGAHYFGA